MTFLLPIFPEDSPFSLPSPGFPPWSSEFLPTNDTFSSILVISTCFWHYVVCSLLCCCILSSSVTVKQTEKWREKSCLSLTVLKKRAMYFFIKHGIVPTDTHRAEGCTDSLKARGQKWINANCWTLQRSDLSCIVSWELNQIKWNQFYLYSPKWQSHWQSYN